MQNQRSNVANHHRPADSKMTMSKVVCAPQVDRSTMTPPLATAVSVPSFAVVPTNRCQEPEIISEKTISHHRQGWTINVHHLASMGPITVIPEAKAKLEFPVTSVPSNDGSEHITHYTIQPQATINAEFQQHVNAACAYHQSFAGSSGPGVVSGCEVLYRAQSLSTRLDSNYGTQGEDVFRAIASRRQTLQQQKEQHAATMATSGHCHDATDQLRVIRKGIRRAAVLLFFALALATSYRQLRSGENQFHKCVNEHMEEKERERRDYDAAVASSWKLAAQDHVYTFIFTGADNKHKIQPPGFRLLLSCAVGYSQPLVVLSTISGAFHFVSFSPFDCLVFLPLIKTDMDFNFSCLCGTLAFQLCFWAFLEWLDGLCGCREGKQTHVTYHQLNRAKARAGAVQCIIGSVGWIGAVAIMGTLPTWGKISGR